MNKSPRGGAQNNKNLNPGSPNVGFDYRGGKIRKKGRENKSGEFSDADHRN